MSNLKKLVLFDIDGVLADDTHRIQYFLDGNYAEYFDRARVDPPLLEGVRLAQEYGEDPEVEVQYLTGRRIDMYEATKKWLHSVFVPNPERITMRGFADRTVLAKYKTGVLSNAAGGGEFSSLLLIDDDPEVVNWANGSFGWGVAKLATWYTKHPEMVKAAKS